MDDRLTKFGNGANSYDLTQLLRIALPSGFGDKRTNVVQLLGMQGGFNADGRDAAKSSIGTVQANFLLEADGTHADMSEKRRAIMQMLDWGESRLFKEFGDGVEAWTWATVTNIQMPQRDDDLSYIWQDVTIIWNCPKSRWYGKPDMLFFEDAWVLDDGLSLSSPKVDQESVGNGSTVEITNNGNATAGAYVRWDIPMGVSVINPRIVRRNEADEIVDDVMYEDTLVADDVVEIDARDHQTLKNMVSEPSYEKLSVANGAWLQLPPGTTTLEISGSFTGGNALLTVDCWDTYF
jgi:hypothetical protein